jgi:hypothetical protein
VAVLAGTDFFTVEVFTRQGLVTYYVLFFIHLESRKVDIAGITVHPNDQWMQQMARNVTMEGCGALRDCRYLLHDRDTKYTTSFRAIIESGQVKTLPLPARSPNLNAYAERWVRSVKVCHQPSADPPWMKLGAVRSMLSPPSAQRSAFSMVRKSPCKSWTRSTSITPTGAKERQRSRSTLDRFHFP